MGDVPTRPQDDQVAWGVQSPGAPVARAPGGTGRHRAQLVLPDTLVQGPETGLDPVARRRTAVGPPDRQPGRISAEESRLRMVGVALIALITVANMVSLVELIHALLYGSRREAVLSSTPLFPFG